MEDAAPQAEADTAAAEMHEVQLEDGPSAARGAANPARRAVAAAAPSKQAQGAGEAAGSSPSATPAIAQPAQPHSQPHSQPRSPPPATQALASVLGFFGGGSGGGGQQEEQVRAGGGDAAASSAAAGGEGQQPTPTPTREEVDAVEAFEREALEAADKVAHAAEEVRAGARLR